MKRREFLHNKLLPGITELIKKPFADIFEVVEKGTFKDVRYFVNKKCVDVNTKNEDGKTLLQWTVELGKIKIIKFLISKGAAADGKTPLHLAVELDKIRIVKSLASKGANVDVKDVDGKTPLHRAVELGKIKIVKCLIYKWADIDAMDGNNLTPLHLAVLGGHVDIAKFLATNGANVRITNELLDWSMKNENMTVIDRLRQYVQSNAEGFGEQDF
jgi:ankyrin repeat protein